MVDLNFCALIAATLLIDWKNLSKAKNLVIVGFIGYVLLESRSNSTALFSGTLLAALTIMIRQAIPVLGSLVLAGNSLVYITWP